MLGPRMLRSCKHAFCFAFAFPLSIVASAQTKSVASSRQASGEQKTARALELARANPLALRAFLVAMPKGGDLHNHLSGAVYAESWIRAAAEDNVCGDPTKLSFSKAQTNGAMTPTCGAGRVPASDAGKDQHLYDALVDAFSMRGFVPSPGVTATTIFSKRLSILVAPIRATRESGAMKLPRVRLLRTNNILS